MRCLATRGCKGERGFTYIGLLFVIAMMGIVLASVGVVWSTEIRREKEAELLFIGDQYRDAITRYHAVGNQFPTALSDLVTDARFPTARHYLRRLYPDPMTGAADWQLILTANGGILGVASSSQARPIKVANFSERDFLFENTACYCDWRFIFTVRHGRWRRAIRPTGTP
jgi:type II secretory pathway pseudopilin PulG